MYHVSAQGVDERIISVHYYYYLFIYYKAGTIQLIYVFGKHRRMALWRSKACVRVAFVTPKSESHASPSMRHQCVTS